MCALDIRVTSEEKLGLRPVFIFENRKPVFLTNFSIRNHVLLSQPLRVCLFKWSDGDLQRFLKGYDCLELSASTQGNFVEISPILRR